MASGGAGVFGDDGRRERRAGNAYQAPLTSINKSHSFPHGVEPVRKREK